MSLGADSENWRAISGYPNYQVSDLGRVRNTTTWRILKGSVAPNGYCVLGLSKNKKVKRITSTTLLLLSSSPIRTTRNTSIT